MKNRSRLHLLVGLLVLCTTLGLVAAGSVTARIEPGIPGDGQNQDSPALPEGVPGAPHA